MSLPESGYLSDPYRTHGEMKQALEALRDAVELLSTSGGGTSEGQPQELLGAQYRAAIDVSGHRAVVLDADGRLNYASNNVPDHLGRLVGITTNAALTGDFAFVAKAGIVTEPSWTWTVGSPIFMGANGLLTQAAPANAGTFSQIVGMPIAATRLFIDIREPILIS